MALASKNSQVRAEFDSVMYKTPNQLSLSNNVFNLIVRPDNHLSSQLNKLLLNMV